MARGVPRSEMLRDLDALPALTLYCPARPPCLAAVMYDDIANNPENPHKGKLFNKPGGEDVYAGVCVDYRGQQVNSANFLAVLAGDQVGVGGR